MGQFGIGMTRMGFSSSFAVVLPGFSSSFVVLPGFSFSFEVLPGFQNTFFFSLRLLAIAIAVAVTVASSAAAPKRRSPLSASALFYAFIVALQLKSDFLR